jgi:hypothetical protein
MKINTALPFTISAMRPRVFAFLAFFVLLVCTAFAVPAAVTGLGGEFVGYGAIRVSWDHEGGAASYRVYRGEDLQTVALIATVTEKYYVDSTIAFGKEYLYYVTAVDSSGEGNAPLYALTVRQTERPDKPFTIKLVSPQKNTFFFGESVEFVVSVSSPYFADLKNLRAVLVNDEFGIEKEMPFDPENNSFSIRETLPSSENGEGFSTEYIVRVTGIMGEETFSGLESYSITIMPDQSYVPEEFGASAASLLLALIPIFLVLAIALLVAFVSWKYYLKRRAEKDLLMLELVGVLRERAVWKYDMLKRRVSTEQYAEKERELQGRQSALEARLGRKKRGLRISENPFAGFSRDEIEEIGQLVKAMGPQKRQMSMDEMRAWIVGRGNSEKVAKKAVEFIYKERE